MNTRMRRRARAHTHAHRFDLAGIGFDIAGSGGQQQALFAGGTNQDLSVSDAVDAFLFAGTNTQQYALTVTIDIIVTITITIITTTAGTHSPCHSPAHAPSLVNWAIATASSPAAGLHPLLFTTNYSYENPPYFTTT
jgi:hypothetical protein